MEYINNYTLRMAALEYANNGIPVFPLIQNEKRPLTPNGFKDATTDHTVIKQWWDKWPNANIGIPAGKTSGWLVLDVDQKKGFDGWKSLDALQSEHEKLAKTLSQLTPSGGGHFIFNYPKSEVRNSASKLGSGLDIRGDGGYIVAAPSVINDNRYVMTGDADSPADAPDWLIELASTPRAVTRDVIISEGERNDYIFQYGLDCKRRGIPQEDATQKAFGENQRCAPPLHEAEVVKTVSSAYRYEISRVPAEIEEMNKDHAAIMVGGNCYVLNDIICPLFGRPDFELLSVKGFKDFNCNRYVEVDGKKKKLAEVWFSHPKRRQYVGLTFNPKFTPEGYYNVWRGFAVEPKQGDCSLYLKHIEENIANGDKAIYDYIIAWMAHTVQHPDNLVGVAIVMKGSMGVGKGVFVEQFGKLFGRHYMLLNDSNQLVGKFNGHMKDKCLLFADEAFWAGDKSAEGKLKSMITESTITIEMKGKDAYPIKNNLHMIFATNNEWAAPAGPKERRFFVIEVGNRHEQDIPYFKAICEQMDNGGREALLHYLKNYDVSDINLRQFPQTTALRDAKLQSASPAQKFWFHVLETGYLHPSIEGGWGDGVILAEYLYESYQRFVLDMGIRHKATDTELGMQLKNMLPKDGFKKGRVSVERDYGTRKISERKNCYFLPSLTECRASFEKFMNTMFEWPAE